MTLNASVAADTFCPLGPTTGREESEDVPATSLQSTSRKTLPRLSAQALPEMAQCPLGTCMVAMVFRPLPVTRTGPFLNPDTMTGLGAARATVVLASAGAPAITAAVAAATAADMT